MYGYIANDVLENHKMPTFPSCPSPGRPSPSDTCLSMLQESHKKLDMQHPWSVPSRSLQRLLDLGLNSLWQLIKHVICFVHPAALVTRF